MQLILDSETSVDIKRNMSTLNEEALTEKLDIIQDLKSGICNGNKENIQRNDNTTSTTEDKPLESEKTEVDFVSDSQTPSDEGKEKTSNKEVNENSAKHNKEEIVNFEDKAEINEDTSTISEDPKLAETVSNSNDTEKLNKSEHVEEILKTVTEERSNGHESISNGLESQHGIEPAEGHQILDFEQITQEDGKVKVSEKDESSTKIDEIVTEKVDEIVTEKVDEIVTEKVDETVTEKVDEIVTEKVDETVTEKVDEIVTEKVDEIVTEKVDEIVTEKVDKIVTEKVGEIVTEKVDKIVSEKVDKSEIFGEITENLENCIREDQRNDVNGKEEDNLKAPDADELPVQGLEKVDVDKFKNSDENDKVDQNSDTAIISLPSSPLIAQESSPKTDSEALHPQISNDQTTEELPNKEDKQANTDEIETVDLDDEDKETEILKADSDIVNIEGEINGQIKTNTESDCLNANKDNQVPEMETVDLDDEKYISETEPMDVDINGETGEVDVKVLPVSTSSEKQTDLTLSSDDNLDDGLSTLKQTKSSVRPMDEDSHTMEIDSKNQSMDSNKKENEEPIDLLDDGIDELKEASEPVKEMTTSDISQTKNTEQLKTVPSILKLSNTLDILSDDEEEIKESEKTEPQPQSKVCEGNDTDKKCINLDDDDDIMLIDEEDEANDKDGQSKPGDQSEIKEAEPKVTTEMKETTIRVKSPQTISEEAEKVAEKDKAKAEKVVVPDDEQVDKTSSSKIDKKEKTSTEVKTELPKPLVPNDFLKTCKKNMAEMTRDDLEEFCILKIVESVVDRSSLSEIKTRLKSMAQSIEEYKKKSMMLTKQNRDLQVVLKTIQEEQKNSKTVTPLKITRSVGMQVLMTERTTVRRKPGAGIPAASVYNNTTPTKSPRATNQRPVKIPAAPSPQQIPVPRLIPASTSPATKNNMQQLNNTGKSSPVNGVRMTPQKPEKRPITRNNSVTVDLTDDEPPAKVNRNSAPTPGRVAAPHLASQNMMTSTPRLPGGQNNPRKVYIPISGPQTPQTVRPGQAIMLKTVTTPNARPRLPQTHMTRMPQNQIRMSRVNSRHPAPLPESNKIYPGNFMKALPPAPDLKLSKVENGIVISWKIEGYQEDSFEEIASYQLYAYQETSAPPSTNLWKKIGDVKALPLPMACTLTQFMAGFKYYFAVRAVDIRSRIGPFSLPGSILLLNKL